jgi:hypothetical protein
VSASILPYPSPQAREEAQRRLFVARKRYQEACADMAGDEIAIVRYQAASEELAEAQAWATLMTQ